MSRLRLGEWLAGAGAALLLASLFSDWVAQHGVGRSGWSSLGWPTLAFAAAAVAAAAWLVAWTALGRPIAQAMAADVVTAVLAPVSLLVLAVRTAIAQPGADATTTVRAGAYVGVAGAVLVAAGAWRAIADERTDAPGSAYVPPPPRPAPPPAEPQGEA
jgi:hypothetical protein